MRKHLYGIAVILLLCAALFALPAAAADVVAELKGTGTQYETLDDALNNFDAEGGTLVLLNDAETVDIDEGGSNTNFPLTIEMNGHGITGMLTVTENLTL